DHGVNAAIALADDYSSENGAHATIVIPQDLPLLTPADVNLLCKKAESPERCLIICPSIRFDGSNALLRKPLGLLKTHYDEDSCTTFFLSFCFLFMEVWIRKGKRRRELEIMIRALL